MWPWSEQTLLREQLAKAETRAEKAEAALIAERESRMRDVRHVLSAWLRHEKAATLPPTAGEKAEAAEAKQAQGPPPLTDEQVVMRNANREEAARCGVSAEDADEDFMRYLRTLPSD